MLTSTVNYLDQMDVRPVFHAQQRQRDNLVLGTHNVEIYDARGLKEAPSLETNGFTLVEHATAVHDFTSAGAQEIYRPEVEVLAQKIIIGGAGNWGVVPMVPNEHVSLEEARTISRWILDLQ